MTQHIQEDEIEIAGWECISKTANAMTFRIKPRPHPNDKYREAFERGELVWTKSVDGSWLKLSFAGTEIWKFTTNEFSLTDPNPVDPYAHLRAANEEGRVAWRDNSTGEWVLPKDPNKWVFGNYPPDPDRYKIVEPDEVRCYTLHWKNGISQYLTNRTLVKIELTLSGLTGKITAKVTE